MKFLGSLIGRRRFDSIGNLLQREKERKIRATLDFIKPFFSAQYHENFNVSNSLAEGSASSGMLRETNRYGSTTTKHLMSDQNQKKRGNGGVEKKQHAGVPIDHAKRSHSQGCHRNDGNRTVAVHIVPGLPQNASQLEGSTGHGHQSNSYRVNPAALFQQQQYYSRHVTTFNPLSVMYFHRQNGGANQVQQQQQRAKHTHSKSYSVMPLRSWQKVASRFVEDGGYSFTVMSYNVLAQELLETHKNLYTNHNKRHLSWESRWNNILSEITDHKPTVLCLQEVQESHLKSHYDEKLKRLGYKGFFKKRTGQRPDGCAIYYNANFLTEMEHHPVEYRQPSIPLLDRDNVGLIAKFAFKKDPGKAFVVATTHLLYNPKRQNIKLAQTQLLLTELDRYAYCRFMDCSDPYLPVIVTGDLNSTPDDPVYTFLTSGKVNYEQALPRCGKTLVPPSLRITDECQHADLLPIREQRMSLSRSEEMDLIKLKNTKTSQVKYGEVLQAGQVVEPIDPSQFSSGQLSHRFALSSVYQHHVDGDVEGTTYQNEWISVDYIFYSKMRNFNKLTLLSRYRLPTRQQLSNILIPNHEAGSDHLPLIAKFYLE